MRIKHKTEKLFLLLLR